MTKCSASIASAVICCSNNGNNKKCKSYELSEAWGVGVHLVWRKLSRWRVCGDTQEHNNCIFGKWCLNLLYHKNQVETYINPHEMPAWSFAGKDAKTWAAVLTWLCRLGSSGLLGLTAADPGLCWAREIWGSSGTRIHSRDQQIYRSAWKGLWRALSAFPSSRHFWCPWCHPMGSGDVGYLELFGGDTLRGTMPPLHQHPFFTCHQEQDILTHHLNPYFFRGEKCL